jgi:hypothetical protein
MDRTVEVPGGRTPVPIAETALSIEGDACNPPLPDGSTFLSATIDAGGPTSQTCAGAPIHVVVDRKRRGLRLAPLPPAVTPEPARTPAATRARKVGRPVAPAPGTRRDRPCRPCAFACLDGVPASGVGPDGCPRCGCEDPDSATGARRR